jgi:hypothetical protein
VAELLNSSPMVFPVLECFHILGFILLAGSIALIDFRLLGALLRDQGTAQLSVDAAPWTLIGLALALISGSLLFASDPDHYYLNHAFQFKMAVLLLALAFHYTVHGRMVRPGASAGLGKLAACISLALWAGVIGGGIFIGFVIGPE